MRVARTCASDGPEVVLLPPRLGHLPGRPRPPALELLPENADGQSLESSLFGETERCGSHILGLLVLDTGTLFNTTWQLYQTLLYNIGGIITQFETLMLYEN